MVSPIEHQVKYSVQNWGAFWTWKYLSLNTRMILSRSQLQAEGLCVGVNLGLRLGRGFLPGSWSSLFWGCLFTSPSLTPSLPLLLPPSPPPSSLFSYPSWLSLKPVRQAMQKTSKKRGVQFHRFQSHHSHNGNLEKFHRREMRDWDNDRKYLIFLLGWLNDT